MAVTFEYANFSDGVNSTDRPYEVGKKQMCDAENITLDDRGAVKERLGTSQLGDTIAETPLLGLHAYRKRSTDAVALLAVCGTDVYKLVTATWTAQSQTLTASKEARFVDAFDSTYLFNQAQALSFDGTTWAAVSGAPLGNLCALHENRLHVAGVANNEYIVNVGDLGLASFAEGKKIYLPEPVTAMISGDRFFYMFTRKSIYRYSQFINYSTTIIEPDKLEKMPTDIGTVSPDSVCLWNSCMIFAAEDGIYRSDGESKVKMTIDCEGSPGWADVDRQYLSTASGAVFNDKYYFSVRETGQSYNNAVYVFDLKKMHQTATAEYIPAFYPWSGFNARWLKVMESSSQEKLFYGAHDTGKIVQMETGTNDMGSNYTGYMVKPILAEKEDREYVKRINRIGIGSSTLGSYSITVGLSSSDKPGTFATTTQSLAVGGSETARTDWINPYSISSADVRAHWWLLKVQGTATKDQPWRVDKLIARARITPRLQGSR